MNASLSHMAHTRFFSARWPEPLTASGAAQACPTCLPSPANQLTFQATPCLGRPLKKGTRFAPRHSSNGGWTSFDPSSGAPGNGFRVSLKHPARPFGRSHVLVHFPLSNDRQDSTFPTEKRRAEKTLFFPCPSRVRHAAGRTSPAAHFRNEFGLFNPIK